MSFSTQVLQLATQKRDEMKLLYFKDYLMTPWRIEVKLLNADNIPKENSCHNF